MVNSRQIPGIRRLNNLGNGLTDWKPLLRGKASNLPSLELQESKL
ncbi:MAG TPA: hypothetical protein VJ751_03325 [Pyrinomonadaceae bacterium]|nr:hypothetical protein [Pyrinomonadaceae bacterium]